jgi:hypothetical protein
MSFITKVFLDWLWGKSSELFTFLLEKIKRYFEYKDIIEENKAQADIVESIRMEIINLIKNGKPVPEELKERLRVESRRLIDSSITTNRSQ